MIDMFKGTSTPRDYAISGAIAGGALLLAFVFYFFVYSAQALTFQQDQARLRQVQNDLRYAVEAQKNYEKLSAEAAQMTDLVKQFEDRLPETREIPTLLKEFEGFAGEIGLNVQLSQLPRVPDAHKETTPYSVKAWGNFHQIASFINRLDRYKRYLKVSDLKVIQAKEGAEASFTLSTFRFKQPSETEEAKPAQGSAS